MPKVSVYLPDLLYDAVRKHEIAVSAVTQQALEAAVRQQANVAWVEQVRARRTRVSTTIDTSALVDEVRNTFGT